MSGREVKVTPLGESTARPQGRPFSAGAAALRPAAHARPGTGAPGPRRSGDIRPRLGHRVTVTVPQDHRAFAGVGEHFRINIFVCIMEA